jgi:putative aminopeptidase FrvX
MQLLKSLCEIRGSSGDESRMTEFLLSHVQTNAKNWKQQPEIHFGAGFQDCIVLVFGKPTTAIFAHIDSIGFTVGYNNELIKIGGPRLNNQYRLVGADEFGEIDCTLHINSDGTILAKYHREISRGTTLTFKPDFRQTSRSVQCCYMDNRLGVYVALQVAQNLENGIICFSTYEEHGGGSVGFLSKFITEKYKVFQALVCDITWATSGVKAGKGVAISLRDSGIPRRSYFNRIVELAEQSKVQFQIEVESAGGSDGSEIQKSIFPIDWCFIGAPEKHVHSPDEWVNKTDIQSMIDLYAYLMNSL